MDVIFNSGVTCGLKCYPRDHHFSWVTCVNDKTHPTEILVSDKKANEKEKQNKNFSSSKFGTLEWAFYTVTAPRPQSHLCVRATHGD